MSPSSSPLTEHLPEGTSHATPPALLEAQQTYLQGLPALLKERPGQWVAYHGTTRLALGDTKDGVWEECLRQGYQEFLLRRIRPHVEADFISVL